MHREMTLQAKLRGSLSEMTANDSSRVVCKGVIHNITNIDRTRSRLAIKQDMQVHKTCVGTMYVSTCVYD